MFDKPFRPLKECQNVARNLYSFFRQEKGCKSHMESADALLERLDLAAKEGRQIMSKDESKMRYHLLSTMYLENRSNTGFSASWLTKLTTRFQNYFLDVDRYFEHLAYITPFVLICRAGSSARTVSGVYFWSQKENSIALMNMVRDHSAAFIKRGILAFLEACLESYRAWHQNFYTDLPAIQAAFSLSSNKPDDQERILASLCFATAAGKKNTAAAELSPEELADQAFWVGTGRQLLSNLIADVKCTPERVAIALLGLALKARWERSARPEGGYREMLESTIHGNPFDDLTLSEVPLSFESQVAFERCLADEKLRELIFAAAVRRERPDDGRAHDLVRTSITDQKLFEDRPPPTEAEEKGEKEPTTKAFLVWHLKNRTAEIFKKLEDAIATLPVDMNYVRQRLQGSTYAENMDIFEFIDPRVCFSYIAEGTARYYRANVAAWSEAFARVGKSMQVMSDLFKFKQKRDITELTAQRGKYDSMPALALKYDFGQPDLDLICERMLFREDESPDRLQLVLFNYANICIVHAVVQKALSEETREILTVKTRDLVFGEVQEDVQNDETVVQ